MHPVTLIEMTVALVFVIVAFSIALWLPTKFRKRTLSLAFLLTVLLVCFFAFRPFWVESQVAKKTEQLNQYLNKQYPTQNWRIDRQTGRQYNPYHLPVQFENETGWTYTYFVQSSTNICQSGWSTPEGKSPEEGMFYEKKHCE